MRPQDYGEFRRFNAANLEAQARAERRRQIESIVVGTVLIATCLAVWSWAVVTVVEALS